MAEKGPIPQSVVDAYKALASNQAPVIERGRGYVLVICPYCADVHLHSREDGPRRPHCTDRYTRRPSYYVTGSE